MKRFRVQKSHVNTFIDLYVHYFRTFKDHSWFYAVFNAMVVQKVSMSGPGITYYNQCVFMLFTNKPCTEVIYITFT